MIQRKKRFFPHLPILGHGPMSDSISVARDMKESDWTGENKVSIGGREEVVFLKELRWLQKKYIHSKY